MASHPTQTDKSPLSRAAFSMREPSGASTGPRLPKAMYFLGLPFKAVKSSMALLVSLDHQMFSSPISYIFSGMAATSRTTSSMGRKRILAPKKGFTEQKVQLKGQPREVFTMRNWWLFLSIP